MAFYACIPDTDFPAGAADLVNLKKGQAWCGEPCLPESECASRNKGLAFYSSEMDAYFASCLPVLVLTRLELVFEPSLASS